VNEIVENPFAVGRPAGAVAESVGSRTMQARENTEVMALAMMAKRFPRDVIAAVDRIKNAFTRVTLAEKAQYQFARGGTDIVGPSIRAAEAMAQQWHNMSSGWRELSRTVGPDGVGVSEVEAFCVDYESTSRESIQFVVRHWRDTRGGGYKLKDERDIYELCANQAARRKRACILAQIPGDVTEMAMDQASVTLKAKADVTPDGIKRLADAFAGLGVTKEQIEKRIQRRIEAIQPAQVVLLKRIYASLRDEMSTVGDWFEVEAEAPVSAGIDAVKSATAARKTAAPRKGAPADPETGDITGAAGGGPPGIAKSLAQWKEQITKAADKDDAAVALDLASDGLDATDLAALAAHYRSTWEAQ
jgi:hypothetical protein